MKLELQSIGVWSFVKVMFFLNLVTGFAFGIFAALFMGLIMTALGQIGAFPGSELQSMKMPMGVILFIMPIFYGLGYAFFGTIFAALGVLIYNLIARLLGGLELNFAEIAPPRPAPAPSPYYAASPPPPPPPPPPAEAPPSTDSTYSSAPFTPPGRGVDPFDPDKKDEV